MEDNSVKAAEGSQQNHVLLQEFASHRESVEEGISHTVKATPLLSSLSLSNKLSAMVITVSSEMNVPTVTGVVMSDQAIEVAGSSSPTNNSTLLSLMSLSNWTILESASSWSAEEVGAVSIISLMVPFILLSNVVVILCVIRFRGLHTPTNYFVTSLAAVDIVVALATPFVIVVEVFHFGDAIGPRDVMLCLLPNRALMMACGVSVLTLAAIAYDRHTALVSPLEYVTIMTSRKVTVMVLASWIYSVVIVWLPLAVGWYNVPSDEAPCSANLINGKAPVLFLGAIFVPSCLAILICYFRIFMVARHHVKAIAAVELSLHRRLQARVIVRDTKYATTLGLIIGAFLTLWLPYLLYIFTKTIISMKFEIWIQTYLILLAVLNSGINPWIYAFKNNELRTALRRLCWELCGDKNCKPVVRRSCQMSAKRSCQVSVISNTPRLSLTESGIVSIITDMTLYTYCGQQKKSLDHLGYKTAFSSLENRSRSRTEVGEISSRTSSVCLKRPVRPTSSCSNFSAVKDVDSLSNTFNNSASTKNRLVRGVAGWCAVNGAGVHHQAATLRRQLSLEALGETTKTAIVSTSSLPPSLIVASSSLTQNGSWNQASLCHSWSTFYSSFRKSSPRPRHHKSTASARQHHPGVSTQATVIHTPLASTLSSRTVTSSTISPHTVTSSTVSPHTVTSSTLSPHTMTSSTVSPHTVTSSTVSSRTVTSSTLSSHTMPSSTLSPHTVASSTVSSHTMTSSTLSPHTMTSSTLSPHIMTSSTLSPHTMTSSTVSSHTVASSTVPPQTVTSSTVYPHTVTSSTVSPHTVTSSTVSPHTVTSSTLPPTTIQSITLPQHTIISPTQLPHTMLPTLHPHTAVTHNSHNLYNSIPAATTHSSITYATVTQIQPPTSKPHTTVSFTPQPHTAVSPTSQPHIAVSPTQHPHTALLPTQQPHTAASPTSQPHTTVSPTQHSHTTLSPTHQPHTAVSPTPQPCTSISPKLQPHTTVSPTQQLNATTAHTLPPHASSKSQQHHHHYNTSICPANDIFQPDPCWKGNNPDPDFTRSTNLKTSLWRPQHVLSQTKSAPFPHPSTPLMLPLYGTLALETLTTTTRMENCDHFARLLIRDNLIAIR